MSRFAAYLWLAYHCGRAEFFAALMRGLEREERWRQISQRQLALLRQTQGDLKLVIAECERLQAVVRRQKRQRKGRGK